MHGNKLSLEIQMDILIDPFFFFFFLTYTSFCHINGEEDGSEYKIKVIIYYESISSELWSSTAAPCFFFFFWGGVNPELILVNICHMVHMV